MIKFYYGTMGAGKTTELIKAYDIYKRKKLEPIVIKPSIDDREGKFQGWGTTQSRITKEIIPAFYYTNIEEIKNLTFNSIFIDEAQFCSKKDVRYLCELVDTKDIPLLAYGLKTDVNGDLFEGAGAWLALADETMELENLCQYPGCNKKAIAHARYINGVKDNSGQSVVIDKGDITYKSVCRKHWRE